MIGLDDHVHNIDKGVTHPTGRAAATRARFMHTKYTSPSRSPFESSDAGLRGPCVLKKRTPARSPRKARSGGARTAWKARMCAGSWMGCRAMRTRPSKTPSPAPSAPSPASSVGGRPVWLVLGMGVGGLIGVRWTDVYLPSKVWSAFEERTHVRTVLALGQAVAEEDFARLEDAERVCCC